MSPVHQHRSISNNRLIHIDGQAKVDTWQTMKRRRSFSPPDRLSRSSPIFVDPKSTLDNWNFTRARDTIPNDSNNIQPIHIDSHSRINTWSDRTPQHRSPINERPTIVHYDHVKSTVDNWQENKRPKRRTRPKLLQVDICLSRSNRIP